MVHHLMVRSLQGRLYLAPIEEDKIQNVLDIGSGTGSRTFEPFPALALSLTSRSGHRDRGRSSRRTGMTT